MTAPRLTQAGLHVSGCSVSVQRSFEEASAVQVGGLGDVVTALGRAVQEAGNLVEVILPRSAAVMPSRAAAHPFMLVLQCAMTGCAPCIVGLCMRLTFDNDPAA